MKFGLSKDIYNKIKNVVLKYSSYEFKIYGSRARGDFKKESDVDIAVFGNINEEDKMKILNDFDLLDVPYMIDIVFFNELQKLVDKTGSPRENIQLGFRHGIIEDGEKWIEIMLSRNLLSHLYEEKASRDIYNKIKSEYIIEFKKLRDRLEEI